MGKKIKHSHNHVELTIGGQAVIEGVLMKTKEHYAIAVRKQDGSIVLKKEKDVSVTAKNKFLGLPFVRGIIVMAETMILGVKALSFSANQIEFEDDPKDRKDSAKKKGEKASKSSKNTNDKSLNIGTAELVFTMILSLVFALALFKFLPLLAANLFSKAFGVGNLAFNLVDGLTKLGILLLYLALIGLMPDVKRLFQYHGAEHKTVACYEKGKKLTVENVKKENRAHPRCGTSFIILVIILSIIFYLFIPMQVGFWMKLLIRIAMLPVIAGLSYELIKLTSKHPDRLINRMLIKPSLLVQNLTTREPDNKQIEVAIASLKAVL